NAEIIAIADDYWGGSHHGLYVFGDANDTWGGTRSIWNQHTYHVTNVLDDGTIPALERNGWEDYNGYRQSRLSHGWGGAAPDLSASFLRLGGAGGVQSLTLRLGNAGAAVAIAGVPVSFYDGEPGAGGVLLGTVDSSSDLHPGQHEDVTLDLPADTSTSATVWVRVDDDGSGQGRHRECREGNNVLDSGVWLNQPPVVSAGADQHLLLPDNQALLAGSVDDDGLPEGAALSSLWTQVSGPDVAVFADPTSALTVVTLPAAGTYVLRLSGTDTAFTRDDDVLVVVHQGNLAPVVSAGPDQTLTLPPQDTVFLAGSISDDGLPLDGTSSAAWTQVSGPAPAVFYDPAAEQTTVQLPQVGTYVLRLTASDGELSAFDDVQVSVAAGNTPPVVSAGADQTLELPVNTALLDGSVSDDGLPVGGTLSVTWSQQAGPGTVTFGDPSAAQTHATFDQAGSYLLRLTASDGELTAFDDVLVSVLPQNFPPVVNAGADQTFTLPPQDTAALQGTVTDDGLPAGGTLSVAWTQVAGPVPVVLSAPDQIATLATFPQPGSYTLRLTADDSQLIAFDDVVVTVEPGNTPPVVSAGPDQTLTLPDVQASLSGTVTDDGLPTGSSLSIEWSHVAGPEGVLFDAPASATTGVTFPSSGTYVLRLSASDGELSAFDELVVTVHPAPPVGDAPVVQIHAPADGAKITGPVDVVGSITSEALLEWRLEQRRQRDVGWTLLAQGSTPQANAPLAVL
ncbi:MAG: PKD domain-containing protein, partial [Candidatus Heimdallarchaeota archaeon]|nr:PKD domain-containing protein [Candidatus Heimdallarchaeota archaeon]